MISRQLIVAAVAGLASQAYLVEAMAHGSPSRGPKVEVVATDLLSPRGLDFAPNGQLFMTEAGAPGTAPCAGRSCYAETGAITLIDTAGIWPAKQVVTGLPVLGDNGPADISFLGMTAYVVVGLGADPAVRTGSLNTAAKAADLSSLIRVELRGLKPHDDYTKLADIGTYELDHNPAGGVIDSNAFGVLAQPGRRIVVDAGANALLEVRANGSLRTLAVFPAELALTGTPPTLQLSDRVPSRVTLGPDGYLYVGEEAFGAGPGQARIYRVPPDGCQPVDNCERYATGFTSIMDLEFDRNGNLYVLETFVFGQPALGNLLIKVDRHRNKTTIDTTVPDPIPGNPNNRRNLLALPGGLALSPNGDYAYISNKTACYGGPANAFFLCAAGEFGEVLRVRLDDDSGHHGKWN